jgi:chromosome segregation ATPase
MSAASSNFRGKLQQRRQAHFVLYRGRDVDDDGRLAERSAAMSIEEAGGGAQTVEQKLDTLSASVDRRFDALSASVDQRFDDVTAMLVEQRQYTEFAFDRLAREMKAGFNDVDSRFNSVDVRFNSVDVRFNSVDSRFNSVDSRFDSLDSRFDSLDSRFNRLERKLDQFIDTQSKANQLMERRLQALETEPGSP